MIKQIKNKPRTDTFLEKKHNHYKASNYDGLVKLVYSNLPISKRGYSPKLRNVKSQRALNFWGTKSPTSRASRQDFK